MNKASDRYDIHVCAESEVSELKRFIDNHWKRHHALAVSPELMDWQHYDRDNKCYNFVVANDTETGEIHGVLGFIPTSQFDNSLSVRREMWLALWKVRSDVQGSGVGLSLLFFLIKSKTPRYISALGLTDRVIPIYKYLGYTTGYLHQYYIVNEDKKDFSLVGSFDGRYKSCCEDIVDKKVLIKYDKSTFSELSGKFEYIQPEAEVPGKSLAYLQNRYVLHPLYKYHIYSVADGGKEVGIIVVRVVSHGSSRALRIVDYYGSPESLLGTLEEFQELLRIHDAEYVDFYNLGFDEELVVRVGFLKRNQSSGIIIPNYFEPFEKKNINIAFAFKSDAAFHCLAFKGDSDQDRPSSIC